VFNIGGNKYRLIAAIHFNTRKLFVRHVLTHREYDQGDWKR
jgi:mRNA interferase HigB